MDRRADDNLSNAYRRRVGAAVVCVLLSSLALLSTDKLEQHRFVAAGMNPFDALGKLFGGNGQPEVLPPDQAFKLDITAQNASSLLASWQIEKGYYLYRDKFRFTLKTGDGLSLGRAKFPKGIIEEDEFFGKVEIYTQELLQITLPLQRRSATAQAVTLKVRYQGCAEVGICYPPVTRHVKLQLPADTASERNAPRKRVTKTASVGAHRAHDRASLGATRR